MIEIEVKLGRFNKSIIYYISKGHAVKENEEDREYLAVCNGVSTLEYQFLYGMKDLFKKEMFLSKISDGFFEIKMNREINDWSTNKNDYSIISKYFLVGIKMLVANYSKYVNLKIIKDKKYV